MKINWQRLYSQLQAYGSTSARPSFFYAKSPLDSLTAGLRSRVWLCLIVLKFGVGSARYQKKLSGVAAEGGSLSLVNVLLTTAKQRQPPAAEASPLALQAKLSAH